MKNNKGITITELIMVALLFGVVALAVSAVYISSQSIYINAYERVIVNSELQYAVDHIYKNVLQGIGDINSLAISTPNAQTLDLVINPNDPLNSTNYANTVTYTYSKSGSALLFDNGNTLESLAPKIVITDVNFAAVDNKLLTVSLTGYYRNPAISVTFDFACYPRMLSYR